jgi:hypothetical protein
MSEVQVTDPEILRETTKGSSIFSERLTGKTEGGDSHTTVFLEQVLGNDYLNDLTRRVSLKGGYQSIESRRNGLDRLRSSDS